MSRIGKLIASMEEYEENLEIAEPEEVSEDEAVEAELYIDETIDDENELKEQVSDIEIAAESFEQLNASMEALIETLEYGIEHKDFSPQVAAVAHISIEHINEMMGTESAIPSLENYNGVEGLEQFYTVALEDITEKLYRGGIAIDRAIFGAPGMVMNKAIKLKRSLAAKSLNKMADKLAAELKEIEAKGKVTFKLGGLKKKLAMAGTVPANVVGAVATDVKSVGELYNKNIPAMLDYFKNVNKELESAVAAIRNDERDKVDNIIDKILKTKRPEDGISEGIRSGKALIGNYRIAVTEPKKHVDNYKDEKSELASQLTRYNPKFIKLDGQIQGPDELEVSSSDAAALIKNIKEYATLLENGNTNITSRMANMKLDKLISNRYIKNEGDFFIKFNRSKDARLQTANKVITKYPTVIAIITNGTFKHNVTSAATVISLAKGILKALKKASK